VLVISHAWGAPRAPRGSNCAAALKPPPCFGSGQLWTVPGHAQRAWKHGGGNNNSKNNNRNRNRNHNRRKAQYPVEVVVFAISDQKGTNRSPSWSKKVPKRSKHRPKEHEKVINKSTLGKSRDRTSLVEPLGSPWPPRRYPN